mgnify:FL=1
MKKHFNYPKNVNYRDARIGDIRDSRLDNTELKTNTSWSPKYNLDSGLKEYAE